MRYAAAERVEIIGLVEQSSLSVRRIVKHQQCSVEVPSRGRIHACTRISDHQSDSLAHGPGP